MRLPSALRIGHGVARHRTARLRAVLGAATAVTGIALALAAYEAPRARERFVQATLADYARYYTATAVDQASWEINRTLRARLLVRLQQLELRRGASPSADAWARSGALVDECRCVPPLPEILHFRTDAPPDSLGVRWTGDPDPAAQAWLARALSEWLRGATDAERWVELFGGAEMPGVAVSAYARRDSRSGTVSVFGYVADVRGVLGIAMTDMMERAPLFPGARAPGAPADALAEPASNAALVRLVLRTTRGDTLFASAPVAAGGAPLSVPRPELGGLEATVVPSRAALALLAPRGSGEGRILALAAGFLLLLALWALHLRDLRRREALVQARGAFVATVSHELRTPLAQILLFAERARDALVDDAAERRQALDVVIREAERLAHLADNAIHVASGAARRAAPRRRPTDLPTLVEEIVERYAPMADAAGVGVELDADDGLVASVDPAAMSQIVLNLLDNALRHAHGTTVVSVTVRRHGSEARLTVEDEGPGVPATLGDAIWEPFARVDAAAAGEQARAVGSGGSGIGLSVVRDLAAAHGGRVWVERGAAGGARFVVALPMVSGAEPALASTDGTAPASAVSGRGRQG